MKTKTAEAQFNAMDNSITFHLLTGVNKKGQAVILGMFKSSEAANQKATRLKGSYSGMMTTPMELDVSEIAGV